MSLVYKNNSLIADDPDEFEELVFNDSIKDEMQSLNRWSINTKSIIYVSSDDSIKNLDKPRYFVINWAKAATEEQDNEFYDDKIDEVFKTNNYSIESSKPTFKTLQDINKHKAKFNSLANDLTLASNSKALNKITNTITLKDIDEFARLTRKFAILNESYKDFDTENAVSSDYARDLKVFLKRLIIVN